jgi:uncharacterized iron-regulated membrane protein
VHFNVVNRKVHYWAAFIVAIPLLVIVCSGILLQLKKHWSWVQPAEIRGSAVNGTLTLDQLLQAARSTSVPGLTGWDDVNRVDMRPSRRHAKVMLHNGWEVQVDTGTGEVLQVAYRRSDVIEAVHDGSIFLGDWTKLGVFLPTGLTLLLLWLGGMWMWWYTWYHKRARRRAKRHARAAGPPSWFGRLPVGSADD